MKQAFYFLLLIVTIGIVSCTKKAGPAKACFTFSKNPAKSNDTVYLLNCSENYARFKWNVPTFGVMDSVDKHTYIVPTATGSYAVGLLIWGLNNVDTTGTVQVLTVN